MLAFSWGVVWRKDISVAYRGSPAFRYLEAAKSLALSIPTKLGTIRRQGEQDSSTLSGN